MPSIYIVLTQTGTLFSRAIRKYTKDPYNHASLAFDPSLAVMYSFGRRRRYNVFNAGFIRENFNAGLFPCFPEARCCVLEVPVSEAAYQAMRQMVAEFDRNLPCYRYNLLGVISYPMRLGLARRNHFFCSQFVSYVLTKAGVWQAVPELTRPMDFFTLPQARVVYEGPIRDYPATRAE